MLRDTDPMYRLVRSFLSAMPGSAERAECRNDLRRAMWDELDKHYSTEDMAELYMEIRINDVVDEYKAMKAAKEKAQ